MFVVRARAVCYHVLFDRDLSLKKRQMNIWSTATALGIAASRPAAANYKTYATASIEFPALIFRGCRGPIAASLLGS